MIKSTDSEMISNKEGSRDLLRSLWEGEIEEIFRWTGDRWGWEHKGSSGSGSIERDKWKGAVVSGSCIKQHKESSHEYTRMTTVKTPSSRVA